MERIFTVEEARALVPDVVRRIADAVAERAALTQAVHAHQAGDVSVPLADIKAHEARLAEILDGFRAEGIEVKGWAPILIDFPARHDGRDILLCLVEGEQALAWFHDAEHGFAGRRPLRELGY